MIVSVWMIFIRLSLDGTYYGMALSVRPSVRQSVRSSVRPTVSTKKHRCKWRIFFKFCIQVCLGVPSINLLFVLSYLIKYAHNSIISDFSIFGIHRVIFSCDQAALWMVQSVRLSVCLSVRPSVCLSVTPFWLCSHHSIIMKFSGVITSDKSDVRAKGQGQRSKVKVTEVTTQLNRFRTVTPVWIHIWWWDDAYSLIMLRRGALLFFKVIRKISRLHSPKILRVWPKLAVSGL